MRCTRCGAEMPDGIRFCAVCGAEAKRAGRTISPTAVGVIAAVLVVAVLAGGAAWWLMGQAHVSDADGGSPARSSTATSDSGGSSNAGDGGSSSAAFASSSADADAPGSSDGSPDLASYIGTWSGSFVSQSQTSGAYRCLGAKKAPLKLVIVDVGTSGRVTADVTVLFHNHKRVTDGEAQSTDGDTVIEVKDLVGSIDGSGAFKFSAELPDSMGTLKLSMETVDKPGGVRELSVTAESDSGYGSRFKDTYKLTKD